ncbi:MAG: 13E12 repeat family protein [Acidimicrobiia bacterium]|nr:13E12 repeat family protein [Acidimicrobiia bacterium]
MEERPEEPAGGSDSAEGRGSDVGPLGREILDLFRAVYRLEARLSERIAAFDASGEWEVDGSASAQAWLRYHGRLSPSAASGAVKTARRLRHLPRTAEAFAAGEISSDHVRVITTGTDVAESLDGHDEIDVVEVARLVAEGEKVLVDAARDLDPGRLRRVVTHWRHAVEPRSSSATRERRCVVASSTCPRQATAALCSTANWISREARSSRPPSTRS